MNEKFTNLGVWGARAWLDVTAVFVIAAIIGLVVTDVGAVKMYASLAWGGHFEPDWSALLLHLGLSALAWAMIRVGLHLAARRGKKAIKVYKARGAVMTETLIAIVPFLLLVSGIAQTAMLNVASLMSDLAVYQAARTAWLWEPEIEIGRNGVDEDDVEFRARTAAALTLAPTASSDFEVGRNSAPGSGPPFRRIRTGISAAFHPEVSMTGVGFKTGEDIWNQTNNNWTFFEEDPIDATSENLTVARAFDSNSFFLRAGRKCTSAWMSIEDFEIIRDRDGEIGARFTYQYAALFPWFAYIFGEQETWYDRTAYYFPIPREMTFPKQPAM